MCVHYSLFWGCLRHLHTATRCRRWIAHPEILHMEIIYLSKENSGGKKSTIELLKTQLFFFGTNNKHTFGHTLLILTYIFFTVLAPRLSCIIWFGHLCNIILVHHSTSSLCHLIALSRQTNISLYFSLWRHLLWCHHMLHPWQPEGPSVYVAGDYILSILELKNG